MGASQLTAIGADQPDTGEDLGTDDAGEHNAAKHPAAEDTDADDADEPGAEEGCKEAAAGEEHIDPKVVSMTTTTASTNAADDYAHRGRDLLAMPLYIYRMHVLRQDRKHHKAVPGGTVFEFEPHYALARQYVQKVMLDQMDVPTIDGFQCPTWTADREQNSLLKCMLFTPWKCQDALTCGSVCRFAHLLSDGCCGSVAPGADRAAAGSARTFTFERAWRTRCSEIQVAAQRAEARSDAAKKFLVLADTTLFAQIKEPKEYLDLGLEFSRNLMACSTMWRSLPSNALRLLLALDGLMCSWHEEQCTLAEYCAYKARDVLAHIDLAAEARVKPSALKVTAVEEDEDDASDEDPAPPRALQFQDVGGGVVDDAIDDIEDVPTNEVSAHPVHDHDAAIMLAFQQEHLEELESKFRLSHEDKQLRALAATYAALHQARRGIGDGGARHSTSLAYKADYNDMLALQTQNLKLAKRRLDDDAELGDEKESASASHSAAEDPLPTLVPLPLALQGPGQVAWKLLQDAGCTEEQVDAVALLALSMERRFLSRPDKATHRLPVATTENNHRAVWLGGGGVGKTFTLCKVVEPLSVTYYGPHGYLAEAHANSAVQNLGPRGKTLYATNGLRAQDSLQTAKLRLNPQAQKKLDRLAGECGVDVLDELGNVSATLLHADALRKTYGRSLRYNLCTTDYMKPQETWGRMPARILCGDFLQLPPVPASASLIAPTAGQSYEHQQGRKLLADIEYVVDFVQMQRFTDPLLREVLEAMRTPGGKKITLAAWNAIEKTELKDGDQRLRDARGWYECAYEWRFVSYAMHAHAKLDAEAAGKILFYIPAVDRVSVHGFGRKECDQMRAEPNIAKTAKKPSVLPVFEGMEMQLAYTILPPKWVVGCPCTVVGIELHSYEEPIEGRASIATDGCVLLRYMPKCIYVRLTGCTEIYLPDRTDFDVTGVMAIRPQAGTWNFVPSKNAKTVPVTRTQIPLLPRKQCTLHGVQGKTADPGFIVHWRYPKRLSEDSKWLAHYVSLSRPRSLAQLLSHDLPSREVIEAGPPEAWLAELDELFKEKIHKTKAACAKARAELGWPTREA